MDVGESGELRGGDITCQSDNVPIPSQLLPRRGAIALAPSPKVTDVTDDANQMGPHVAPMLSSSPRPSELNTLFEGKSLARPRFKRPRLKASVRKFWFVLLSFSYRVLPQYKYLYQLQLCKHKFDFF